MYGYLPATSDERAFRMQVVAMAVAHAGAVSGRRAGQ